MRTLSFASPMGPPRCRRDWSHVTGKRQPHVFPASHPTHASWLNQVLVYRPSVGQGLWR